MEEPLSEDKKKIDEETVSSYSKKSRSKFNTKKMMLAYEIFSPPISLRVNAADSKH